MSHVRLTYLLVPDPPQNLWGGLKLFEDKCSGTKNMKTNIEDQFKTKK